MRKIIVISMISLDGVMQAPGGAWEDPSDDFRYGGWVAPYDDEAGAEIVQKQMQPAEYLLGRKTFKIWESYWPQHAAIWPAINEGTKYVLSTTVSSTPWKNSVFLKSLEDIKKLKNSEGADLHVWGSSQLVQLLFAHDLVDEFQLKIYPLTLGKGKRIFDTSAMPAAFTLTESLATPKGVIIAHYKRAGEVITGTIGE